jgi:uncharacterized protein YecE (DUF72 family)
MRSQQLSLFGDETPESPRRRAGVPVRPAVVPQPVAAIAARLPTLVRLGTSSWSFPGWGGLVYAARADGRPETESRLARDGLTAYATHPLFRTVSLDRTFYAPLSEEGFCGYAASVPDHFRFVVKAPAAVTDPALRKPGSGEPAGDNPMFLDPRIAAESFVRPAVAGLGEKAGPLVFQFPPLGRRLLADPPRLAARLAAFLTALPRGAVHAVELRDPECMTKLFADAIRDGGGVPCLAVHARMPPVEEQAEVFGAADARTPVVARWNLHAGRGYEEARADYFPFDRLVEEDLPTRRALAGILRAAAREGRESFVTINNKAEGSAPLSVWKLAEAVVA